MSDAPGGPGWWMADDRKWYPPADAGRRTASPDDDRFAPPLTGDRFRPPNRVPSPPLVADEQPSPSTSQTAAARGSTGPAQPSSRRRAITLIFAMLALCAAAVGMYFVGSSGPDTSMQTSDRPASGSPPGDSSATSVEPGRTNSPEATTTVDPTAEADLRAIAVADGPAAAVAVDETPDGPIGISLPSGKNVIDQPPGELQIWRLEDGVWSADRTVATPAPVSSWTVDDVTGDGVNDLVLQGFLGNDAVGMVMAAHAGAMKLIPFNDTDGTRSDMTGTLRFEAAGLTSSSTPCVPDCATGGVIDQVWTFDPATGEFAA